MRRFFDWLRWRLRVIRRDALLKCLSTILDVAEWWYEVAPSDDSDGLHESDQSRRPAA